MTVRVSPNIVPDVLSGLNGLKQQRNTADLELASGRSINTPSDNPSGIAALVLNHAAQSSTDTFERNIGNLQSTLQIADSALNSAVGVINQAISLGVQAGNSSLSAGDRQAIAQQLQGIQQQLLGIANTRSGGTYLFAGTQVETQPFTLNSSSASGVNYSSSQVDKRKVGQLAMAIQVAFQQMGIFDASNTRPEIANSEPMPFSKVQMVENQERVQAMGRLVNTPRGALGESPDKPDMNQIQKQLETALAAQIGKHTVSVTPTKEGIVVSLREMGFFDSGSTSLRPEAEPTLADFVSVVGPRRVRVRIEGHTDNVPIHNNRFASNWELSTSRATEIIKLLITKYGVAPLRLSASGYSEFYPVASNATLEGRAMNRRVDLVILNSQTDSAPPVPAKAPTNPSPQTRN
jgi:chemotaxis protein MotB